MIVTTRYSGPTDTRGARVRTRHGSRRAGSAPYDDDHSPHFSTPSNAHARAAIVAARRENERMRETFPTWTCPERLAVRVGHLPDANDDAYVVETRAYVDPDGASERWGDDEANLLRAFEDRAREMGLDDVARHLRELRRYPPTTFHRDPEEPRHPALDS